MRRFCWTSLLLLVAGCSNSPDEVTPAASTNSEVAAPSHESVVATEVTVDIKSWEEVEKWVAGQKGKPVVIDVWSSS